MRKFITLAVAMVVMAVPSVALAAAPLVLFDGSDGFVGVVPAGGICDFEVNIDEAVDVRVTVYFDKYENPVKERVHIVGRTTWSTDDGVVEEHWAVNETYDIVNDELTITGNRWNGHSPTDGPVINGSGRIHIDFATDDVTINGPSQDFDDDVEGFCNALAP